MSPGQMLPGQMSPWQLESVLDVPWSLSLNFHQNWISNSWDIADIEFVWWGGVGGWGLQRHFHVKPNRCVEVRLGFWQFNIDKKVSSEWQHFDSVKIFLYQHNIIGIFISFVKGGLDPFTLQLVVQHSIYYGLAGKYGFS